MTSPTLFSSKPNRPIDLAGRTGVLVPMLLADLLGVAASSTRVPGFGRRPHQVAYVVCLATVARQVLDDRGRHADAVAQLVLLMALAGTRGGSRTHRGTALASTAAAIATTVRRRRTPMACSGQPSANCS
jgi:hypothetical protein